MPLQSPRFASDPLLQEIADDPDTGQLKLGPGSPPDSVSAVQAALFDLQWTRRLTPPVFDRDTFVIGVYGPLTKATVTLYKTHYDIHYPPDQPTGFIDEFVGPRTLQRLDGQCVLLDEADAALADKAAQLPITGVTFDPPTVPLLGTPGAIRFGNGTGTIGVTSPAGLWYKPGLGAFLVQGLFFSTYNDNGGETGALGFPTGDQTIDGEDRRQSFEHGEIVVLPDFTATVSIEPPPPAPPPDPDEPF
jgi:hypothetical protein